MVPGPWDPTPEPLTHCSPAAYHLDKRSWKTMESIHKAGGCLDDSDKESWEIYWVPTLHQLLAHKLYVLSLITQFIDRQTLTIRWVSLFFQPVVILFFTECYGGKYKIIKDWPLPKRFSQVSETGSVLKKWMIITNIYIVIPRYQELLYVPYVY